MFRDKRGESGRDYGCCCCGGEAWQLEVTVRSPSLKFFTSPPIVVNINGVAWARCKLSGCSQTGRSGLIGLVSISKPGR